MSVGRRELKIGAGRSHPDKLGDVRTTWAAMGAAMSEPGNRKKQGTGRWANDRVENSHLPFRRRERAMHRFRQVKMLRTSASVHADVHSRFSLERHLVDRRTCKQRRSAALAKWQVLAS